MKHAIADDLVLVDEMKKDVNTKLEIWRNMLESKCFKLSRVKIKYMECKFSKNISVDDVMNKFEHQIIPRKYQF